jgi:hypothetical protein
VDELQLGIAKAKTKQVMAIIRASKTIQC